MLFLMALPIRNSFSSKKIEKKTEKSKLRKRLALSFWDIDPPPKQPFCYRGHLGRVFRVGDLVLDDAFVLGFTSEHPAGAPVPQKWLKNVCAPSRRAVSFFLTGAKTRIERASQRIWPLFSCLGCRLWGPGTPGDTKRKSKS